MLTFFDKMVETSFLTEADRAKIFISDSLEEIGAFIDSYEPPMIRQYEKLVKKEAVTLTRMTASFFTSFFR